MIARGHMTRRWVRTECLWVISDDPKLQDRVKDALAPPPTVCLRFYPCAKVEEPGFWRTSLTLPGAVLLDLDGEKLDWGARVLRDIKHARLRPPVIVLSREFDEEFGSKIVTEGPSYFMAWDFDPAELNEVVRSLLHHAHHAGQ